MKRLKLTKKQILLLAALSLAALLGSVVAFLLTEDMRLPMVLVDKWTWLMGVFTLGGVVPAGFSLDKRQSQSKAAAV